MRINNIWSDMKTEKGDLITRCEQYSRWTVSALMPEAGGEGVESRKSNVTIGARVVNHLANRIVDVLFPVSRPFFTVALTPATQLELEKEMGEAQAAVMREQISTATAKIERSALRKLGLTKYRPVAILAAKHMTVCGNALLRRMPDGDRILYPVDRYGVRRNILGEEIEVVLSDKKMFSTFDKETQKHLLAADGSHKPEDIVELLTHYKLAGKRWAVTQEAAGIPLNNDQHLSLKDYDLLVLDWTLHPGENYGRGLVEDYAATFHNIDVTNECVIDLIAVIADIKFFVRPGSATAANIAEMNNAPRGTYWVGNGEDITVPEVRARGDLETLLKVVAKWEAELKDAFLMSSVRDAERVTAEEIRMIANQLESSFGGLYSQLAMTWQQKEADYAISKIDFKKEIGGLADAFEVIVTTGLESLSREGQIDNLRLAIGDLQMMEAVPEGLQSSINALRFAKFVFTNRSVDLSAFLNTQDEMQANQAAQMALAGRAQQEAGQNEVAVHAGKAAIDKQQT